MSEFVDKKRVLIIDDEKGIAEIMKMVLETELGLNCSVALDGHLGLAILERDPDFQLIILDYMMPIMNGERVVDAIDKHKNPILKTIPILLATAAKSGVLGVRDLNLPVIKKPMELEDLLDKVSAMLLQGKR